MAREVNAMDVFGEVEKASASSGAQYVQPGQHVFEIDKLLLKESDRDNRVFFIAEMKVVESSREDTEEGATRSWIVDMTRKETGPSNVKAFAMSLAADLEEEDITKEDLTRLVGNSQPAQGVRINCEAWHTETKKGNLFTKTKWDYHSGSIQGEEDTDSE
jgi:hypothetical protein